jgi:zinc protease
VTLRPDSDIETVRQVLDEEISEVLEKPVNKHEVAKAIKQARALFAYGSESITNQGLWLGFSEMFASYEWFESYLDRLEDVTPQGMLEVAQKRLAPKSRTVGMYLPNGNS